ncbi:MAG: hypothetical protein Terrestrivirus5_86 [Terrestrivirus sp.]|uniref:RING-type domain-containing protein n=1 Tax=Terrestrivirus sp. TaxID=2487775 RepID=A0A3G4ZPD2_9VIRU|nr:MAG: hypothetical protein Terrestrivirus5_86 [Terrestrivirus sp.]
MEHLVNINTKDRFKCKLLFDYLKNHNYKIATELLSSSIKTNNTHNSISLISYGDCFKSSAIDFCIETKNYYTTWDSLDSNIFSSKYDVNSGKTTLTLTLSIFCEKMNVLHFSSILLLIYHKLMDSSIFGNTHIKYLSEVQELITFIESLIKICSNDTNRSINKNTNKNGVDNIINTVDGDYNTALHYISKTQYVSIAKILINSGADIHMVNKYNRNPIDIAKEIYEKNIESMNEYDDVTSYQKMIDFLTSCDDDCVSSPCSSINSRDDTIKCIMCMTENKNILVLPCKHISICEKCFKNIQNKTEKCCICRSRIVDYMKVYIV